MVTQGSQTRPGLSSDRCSAAGHKTSPKIRFAGIVRYHAHQLMCGIAGLISQNPEAHAGAMLKSIEHRGRDDEGVWTSSQINDEAQRVCFGHRRLSIIDTSSAGHQPMLSADGRLVVIFN